MDKYPLQRPDQQKHDFRLKNCILVTEFVNWLKINSTPSTVNIFMDNEMSIRFFNKRHGKIRNCTRL